MRSPEWSPSDLNAELVFDRFIGTRAALDELLGFLTAVAPRWSTRLTIRSGDDFSIQVAPDDHHAFTDAVLAGATKIGPTYTALTGRTDISDLPVTGSVEIRGVSSALTVVLSIAEEPAHTIGGSMSLENDIALQVRSSTIERIPSREWLRKAFESACERLGPSWGRGGHPAEYWAKVMSEEPPLRAVGRDFARYLPGVFWLNYYGGLYTSTIGRARLKGVPWSTALRGGEGFIVILPHEPTEWDTPAYAISEQTVRDAVGDAFFFSKAEPDRPTIAPPWAL